MGNVINGREISAKVKEQIKAFVEKRKSDNKSIPKIASILVGNDGGSIYYMNSQEKTAVSLGVLFEKVVLDENTTESELINVIEKLNNDKSVSGIIMQLPLPKHINEKVVVNKIWSKKDIDCLTTESVGKMYMGEDSFMPCTPLSVITLLKSLDIKLQGKRAVVIGRSNIVGKPVYELLLRENATVTICHSKTENLKEVTKEADILVSAIGRPKFIDDTFIKEGAVVIDVGTSSFEGKITGDVDFDKVINKASRVTPVPGGVGALTTTLLIKNACEALIKNEN
ncbi:tetrahydrofolate dehydrogenase/cyclohydrolase catalytic domain-containing protein [Clostridium sp. HCP1S3_B4]|uniref:tetrahydrofolate dehydrogenase/cyclohydrolase catalytic domain-containing protein n=1 Tax=unclassified Clostridium TaxID=2614128 RepID=UPI002A7B3701|nr:tetrahydrofolate dehydrogenase/cyclohydrolase catalytic domain-containing protein [Clostridiales bacterium]MDY2728572.1 tetrahydrofolate dehydrogenase/cyclohydrolase catalytic domain-containing protein [Clostridium sp.]